MNDNLAYQYSLKLLSRRDYSSFKLRKKLNEKKFEANQIEAALEALVDKKYINDQSYYERKARRLLKKNYSAESIWRECNREKAPLSLEHVKEIVGSEDGDEELKKEISKRLLKNNKALDKLATSAPQWERKKIINKIKLKTLSPLIRKGHSFEQLSELYDALQKEMAKAE